MTEEPNKVIEGTPEDKPNYLTTILLLVMIIIIVVTFFYALNAFKNIDKEGMSCLDNPLVYGAKRLATLNDNEASCSCTVGGGIMFFNDRELNSNKKEDFYGLNISYG